MALKQLEVQIMGQSYLLGAPEGGEQQLLTAVEKVDTAMCKIRDAGKVKARDRIAVLAALNLAFETDRPAVSNGAQTSAAKAPAHTQPLADVAQDRSPLGHFSAQARPGVRQRRAAACKAAVPTAQPAVGRLTNFFSARNIYSPRCLTCGADKA